MEEMILLAADILQEVLSADLKELEKTVVFVEGWRARKVGRKASSHWLTLLEIAKLPRHHLHPLRKGADSVRDLGMDPTLGKL